MKHFLRWVAIGSLFIVPIVPLYVSSALFFPFITGKNFLFRVLIEIGLISWVALWFFDKDSRPKASPLTVMLSVFTIIIAAADIFGVSPAKSLWSNFERMEGFVTVAHLAGFALVSSTLFTPQTWIRWFATSLVVATYTGFYGLSQLAGGAKINQSSTRLDGNIGNAAYFAMYLIFHTFTALILGFRFFGFKRWLSWSPIPLLVIITYFTATRGALLGLIGGLGVAALLVAVWGKAYPRLRKVSIATVLVLVVLVGGFIAIRDTAFVRQNPVLTRFAEISVSNLSETSRFIIWDMALKGVAERPILGWGQENFNYVFNQNYDARLFEQEQWFDRTHNVILDWMIAGGVLGFVSYLGLFVVLLLVMWRSTELSFIEKSLITGLMAAYTIHNFFVFDSLVSYIFFFAWFAYIQTMSQLRAGKKVSVFDKPATNWSVIGVAGAIALFCVVSIPVSAKGYAAGKDLLYVLALQQTPLQPGTTAEQRVQDVHARYTDLIERDPFANTEVVEQMFQTALQFANFPVSDELKKAFIADTEKALLAQIARTPNDARHEYFLGVFYGRIQRYDDAITHLKRAIELSPQKVTFIIELGSTYLQKGEIKPAVAEFKKAYELAGQFSAVKRVYLMGVVFDQDRATEQQLLAEIPPEDLLSDSRIANVYRFVKREQDLRRIYTQIGAEHPELSAKVQELLK